MKFKSPEELKIFEGQLRHQIYNMIVKRKTHEEIYNKIKADGGFQTESRSDALNYISYFNKQMINE